MSDNTPTFHDALEAIGTLLNIDVTNLFGELYEDVELARQALVKRAKNEKSDVEQGEAGAQSRKFNSVDFWPAMDSDEDDLNAALASLGVDKEDDEDDAVEEKPAQTWGNYHFHVSDIDDAFKKFQRLQQRKAAGYIRRDVTTDNVESKSTLSTWRVTPPHDSWGDETVEAETLDIDPTEGIYAYIGDTLVFHAPAGTYSYVRKVA